MHRRGYTSCGFQSGRCRSQFGVSQSIELQTAKHPSCSQRWGGRERTEAVISALQGIPSGSRPNLASRWRGVRFEPGYGTHSCSVPDSRCHCRTSGQTPLNQQLESGMLCAEEAVARKRSCLDPFEPSAQHQVPAGGRGMARASISSRLPPTPLQSQRSESGLHFLLWRITDYSAL